MVHWDYYRLLLEDQNIFWAKDQTYAVHHSTTGNPEVHGTQIESALKKPFEK